MGRILIIGAGGVGSVVAQKCARQPEIFSTVMVASRSPEKCETIRHLAGNGMQTAQVDANRSEEVFKLLQAFRPEVVINTALPGQNLPIMAACLAARVHYLDTSAPEPVPDRYEMFAYRWQQQFHRSFQENGITGLLSLGFAPGITNVFCAYAAKHLFDEIQTVDILDCNGGSHHQPFATNFNPLTNIAEVTQPAISWEDGTWQQAEPFSICRSFDFQEIGRRNMYLLYHEELETLQQRFPNLKQLRFWMHFSDSHIHHLRVLKDLGLTSLEPVPYNGARVSPAALLDRLLPDPAGLGRDYTGKTNIGCLFSGLKDGRHRRLYLYNVCDHAACYREVRSQAVSYTSGVPAMIGARLLVEGRLREPGVFLPEELDPDPIMAALPEHGLPWQLVENPGITLADEKLAGNNPTGLIAEASFT